MPVIPKREKRLLLMGSLGAGLAVVAAAFISVSSRGLTSGVDDLFLIAVVLTIFPAGVVEFLDRRWKLANDMKIPEFLRDIVNGQRTGMTFVRALENAANQKYGPLSTNLRWAMSRMSWGASFDEALTAMANRIDTTLAKRAVSLVITAAKMGGDIAGVMDMIALNIREIEQLNRNRLTEMRPYVFIIYIGFFILMFALGLTFTLFLKPLATTPAATQLFQGGGQRLSLEFYRRVFFHASIVEAFFGGLLAGQMGEGSFGAGLKHSVIMMIAALAVFTFIVR